MRLLINSADGKISARGYLIASFCMGRFTGRRWMSLELSSSSVYCKRRCMWSSVLWSAVSKHIIKLCHRLQDFHPV